MGLQIKEVSTDEVTGWVRYIEFSYDNKDYSVKLHWDAYDGYDIYSWNNIDGNSEVSAPDWVQNYKSKSLGDDENGFFALCFDLDNLSESVSA
jgi:hypothetical protein